MAGTEALFQACSRDWQRVQSIMVSGAPALQQKPNRLAVAAAGLRAEVTELEVRLAVMRARYEVSASPGFYLLRGVAGECCCFACPWLCLRRTFMRGCCY